MTVSGTGGANDATLGSVANSANETDTGAPVIVLVGDDTFWALGPEGFDRPSLEKIVRRSGHAVVVTGAPLPLSYNIAATCAARWRRNAVLIETQPARRDAWLDFLKSANRQIGFTVCVPGEEATQ